MAPEAENRAQLGEAGAAAPVAPFDDSPRGRTLKAMVEVIAHGGYHDATVDRVLERARVGWEEFMRLFGDLDGCFIATLEGGFELAAAQATEAIADLPRDAAIEAVFEPALRAVLECAAANPGLTNLCLVEAPALGLRALDARETGLQRFVDLLVERSGAANRTDGGAPPSLAAEMVVGGIHEVMQRKARAGELSELPGIAAELRQLWLPALRET